MEEYIPKSKVLELWRYWKYIEAYDQTKAMKGIRIINCSECANWLPDRKFCVHWHVGTFEDNFCYMAKRSSDGKMQSELGIRTKTIKYFDEDEKVWTIGEVIIDE